MTKIRFTPLLTRPQECQGCQKIQTTKLKPPLHSDLKCPITFGNLFWHLTVGNRPIVLNFYQQRPVFALKNCPRPQRPKKANEGQQRPAKSKTLNFFVIITIQCKIINKCKYTTKKMCFKEIWNFHFHYINFLKTPIFSILFTFVDNFTLNSDNNKEIWRFGLCWLLLAFIGLFGFYGLGWFF